MFTLMQTHLLAKTMTVTLRSLTDLFFALWGVTTPISSGMHGCENMHLGFLRKEQNGCHKSIEKKLQSIACYKVSYEIL